MDHELERLKRQLKVDSGNKVLREKVRRHSCHIADPQSLLEAAEDLINLANKQLGWNKYSIVAKDKNLFKLDDINNERVVTTYYNDIEPGQANSGDYWFVVGQEAVYVFDGECWRFLTRHSQE